METREKTRGKARDAALVESKEETQRENDAEGISLEDRVAQVEEGMNDTRKDMSDVKSMLATLINAYQPIPTHGSSHRVAQRIGGPPIINGRTTASAAKPRFVRICYEKMFQGRCEKQDCRYCHDEDVIKAFIKAHPDRHIDSPYHPSKQRG